MSVLRDFDAKGRLLLKGLDSRVLLVYRFHDWGLDMRLDARFSCGSPKCDLLQ